MIDVISNCFGCGICSVSCGKNAIEMSYSDDGFLKPVLNQNKCVKCGVCLAVCPENNKNEKPISKTECYASRTVKTQQSSSSGGLSYALAEKAIADNIPVCGVTYENRSQRAEHITISSVDDLYKIQGSKYLQSFTQTAFNEIIKHKQGLVFGTPCQIAGVSNILQRQGVRDNYILIDIFCHGVPSAHLWHNHLDYIHKKYGIDKNENIAFRDKKEFRIIAGKYKKDAQVDPFYYFYLRGLVNNKACYSCPFRRSSSADIRLGDHFSKDAHSQSVVILNSKKGKNYFLSLGDVVTTAKLSYDKDVDMIQDKDQIKPVPEERKAILGKLKNGQAPAVILGKKKIAMQHLKGLVKKIIKK